MGANKKEEALIYQFVALSTNELAAVAAAWLYPIMGYAPNDEARVEKAKTDCKRALGALNVHLLDRTYLVGECVTLADINVATFLHHLYELVFEPEFIAPFKNVTRWFTTIVNQPNFKAVFGEQKYCQKMAVGIHILLSVGAKASRSIFWKDLLLSKKLQGTAICSCW
jgi:elongation factor 1-gamma